MIHLVVPPAPSGGVYDFALRLQQQLGQDRAQVVHLSKARTADWQAGPQDDVVVQMSGYGFQKRGAPLWLLRELRARRNSFKSLGIFFHELYAFGAPWRSSFWLSPVQRHIARELAAMSDFWLTNREASADWLLRRVPAKPHQVLPVFSNIGEAPWPNTPRQPRLVVFGSAGSRQATYRAAGPGLFAMARRCSLELHDIGSPLPDAGLADELKAQGIVMHGRLDPLQAGEVMSACAFGMLAYPLDYVAKSSVFASYCAHGLSPILISDHYPQTDGLTAGVHYIAGIGGDSLSLDLGERIGKAAWDWYQPHRLQCHAAALARLLGTEGR